MEVLLWWRLFLHRKKGVNLTVTPFSSHIYLLLFRRLFVPPEHECSSDYPNESIPDKSGIAVENLRTQFVYLLRSQSERKARIWDTASCVSAAIRQPTTNADPTTIAATRLRLSAAAIISFILFPLKDGLGYVQN
ncbi:hypothetical protein JXR01_00165 [Candidatus Kaiserbacteria bacterium]|nr:MAG: hypothetical protein JXR01_00165 [Candidatus Kaiserbacteria bacterium]